MPTLDISELNIVVAVLGARPLPQGTSYMANRH